MQRLAAFMVIGLLLGLPISLASPSEAQPVVDWKRFYNGPGNGVDVAVAMALDTLGNIYVAGTSEGAGTSQDIVTIKYDGDGNSLWKRRFNGSGNAEDLAADLAVDGQGNVIVTGSSVGDGTGYDIVTFKYDPDGNKLWARRVNGLGNGNDYAKAVRVDGQGNVHVTGKSFGGNTAYDIFTVKYDPDGNKLWARRVNGDINGNDEPNALALDGKGNVYVAGKTQGPGTGEDGFIIKYNPNGREKWAFTYNGPANGDDQAVDVGVGPDNNVYFTGSSWGDDSLDLFTARVNPDGSLEWVHRYNGAGNGDDTAKAIAFTPEGNVIVLGNSKKGDAWTVNVQGFDGLGTRYFLYNENAELSGNAPAVDSQESAPNTAGNALAVDSQGNSYVAGKSQGASTGNNFYLLKINANGKKVWQRSYNGSANLNDEAFAVAVDDSGNVHAAGSSQRTGTGTDCATIKYKQTP